MFLRFVFVCLGVVLIFIGIVFWGKMSRSNANEGHLEDRDPNETVFDSLRDNGDDLTVPRETTFVVYFEEESDAIAAVDPIEEMGYSTQILAPEPDEEIYDWTCECNVTIIPELEDVIQRLDTLGLIVAPFNGIVDGWETYVITSQRSDPQPD